MTKEHRDMCILAICNGVYLADGGSGSRQQARDVKMYGAQVTAGLARLKLCDNVLYAGLCSLHVVHTRAVQWLRGGLTVIHIHTISW